MPQTQLIKERKERVELKKQRREQGLCIECGENEAIAISSHTAVFRCVPCLALYHANRKPKSEHVISRFVKPKRTEDGELIDYTEQKPYLNYCIEVSKAIAELLKVVDPCYRDIKEAYPHLDTRDLANAVESLISAREYEWYQMGKVSRLRRPTTRPVKRLINSYRDWQVNVPKGKEPYNEAIYAEAR